jgi:hypothetical protein
LPSFHSQCCRSAATDSALGLKVIRDQVAMCGPTFELTGPRRQDASTRADRRYSALQPGPGWPAVAGLVEREVRFHAFPSIAFERGAGQNRSAQLSTKLGCLHFDGCRPPSQKPR